VTKAEYMRGRREKLIADGKCIDCQATLLGEDDSKRCFECRDRGAKASRKYKSTDRGKAADRDWKRRDYHANLDLARLERRVEYARKKQEGECQHCRLPALDGASHCEAHLAAVRESHRRSQAKRAASARRAA
jgi:hypothetical protein